MVSTSGDLCYGCGWKLPAAGGEPGGSYLYTKENGYGQGGPAGAAGGLDVAHALPTPRWRQVFLEGPKSDLAEALNQLEAFDAGRTSPDAHVQLAGILDDICRAWKALKEPG